MIAEPLFDNEGPRVIAAVSVPARSEAERDGVGSALRSIYDHIPAPMGIPEELHRLLERLA